LSPRPHRQKIDGQAANGGVAVLTTYLLVLTVLRNPQTLSPSDLKKMKDPRKIPRRI